MQPGRMATLPPDSSLEGAVTAEILRLVGQTVYDHWFRDHVRCQIANDEFVVAVESPFLQTWLQRQFKEAVTSAAQAVLGPAARVRFEVTLATPQQPVEIATPAMPAGSAPGEEAGDGRQLLPHPPATWVGEQPRGVPRARRGVRAEPAPVRSLSRTLRPTTASSASLTLAPQTDTPQTTAPQSNISPPSPTLRVASAPTNDSGTHETAPLPRGRRFADLQNFVGGRCNELAMTAVRQTCEAPGENHNPLYLYGGVGTGKTHLLEGMYRQLRGSHPLLQVTYLTAENFANYFTQALRQHSLPSFRLKFRTIDVLLLDDIEFFDGKTATQEEFLHTLSTLTGRGRQLVIAGDRHPRMLLKTTVDLQSRLLAGMVCRLDAPDLATRREILIQKSRRLGCELTPEALEYVATRFSANVRELEGAIHSLRNFHVTTGRKLGITAVREALLDLERDCTRVVRLADIDRTITNLFGLTETALRSAERTRSVTQPRMLAMYLARQLTPAAYSEIGGYFGGRNHSTVISAERKIEDLRRTEATWTVAARDWPVGALVETIRQQLLAG